MQSLVRIVHYIDPSTDHRGIARIFKEGFPGDADDVLIYKILKVLLLLLLIYVRTCVFS